MTVTRGSREQGEAADQRDPGLREHGLGERQHGDRTPAIAPLLMARVASVLFAFAAAHLLVNLGLPHLERADVMMAAMVGAGALAVAIVTWNLPWDAWHHRALLVLPVAALTLVALGQSAVRIEPFTYSMYFLVAFAWVGMTQPRWTSLWLAAPATAAYLVPLIAHDRTATELTTVLAVVPTCVMLAEFLAWTATRLGRAESELARSESSYRSLFEENPQPMFIYDMNTLGFVAVNDAAIQHYGYSREEFLTLGLLDIRPEEDIPAVLDNLARNREGFQRSGTWRHRKSDGETIEVEITSHSTSFEGREARQVSVSDVTERNRSIRERERVEAELAHHALHDSLTGLPNRTLLLDRLTHALALAEHQHRTVSVLWIDLDDFKSYNDVLGHEAGDRLLITVAGRLRDTTRPEDTVARIGADEFAVVLEEVDETGAVDFAERAIHAVQSPVEIAGRTVGPKTSLGLATSRSGAMGAEELMRNADVAMRFAKSQGRDRLAVFEPRMHEAVLRRSQLKDDLERAVEVEEFMLHYQPIVSLETGRPVWLEGLVRWSHPQQGLIAPNEFIPAAEETGLIVPLGRWVIHQAARQMKKWRNGNGHPGFSLSMSINLSTRQLQHPELVDTIEEALTVNELPPDAWIFEITESMLLGDMSSTSDRLEQLRSIGVKIAIDDFGTGYSSLAYLQHLPVDVLKIDRAFIDGVAHGSEDSALAQAIVKLGQSLDLTVVAEGIETEVQARRLHDWGCALGQGYYFSRPVEPDELHELITDGQR